MLFVIKFAWNHFLYINNFQLIYTDVESLTIKVFPTILLTQQLGEMIHAE